MKDIKTTGKIDMNDVKTTGKIDMNDVKTTGVVDMNDVKTTGATDDIIEIKNELEQLKTTTPAKVLEICAKLDKLKEKVDKLNRVKDAVDKHNKMVEEMNKKYLERFWGDAYDVALKKFVKDIHVISDDEWDKMLDDYHNDWGDD